MSASVWRRSRFGRRPGRGSLRGAFWNWVTSGFALAGLSGCVGMPAPEWPEGGATLALADAFWHGGMGRDVAINRLGQISVAGELVYSVDRAGRVRDRDGAPFALLKADGYLVGPGAESLGRLGTHNAAPPWSGVAWLRVEGDGSVFLFGEDQIVEAGTWVGCSGEAQRLCTLVTQLFALDAVEAAAPPNAAPAPVPRLPYHPNYWYPNYWMW